jgi:hypothetical protein
MNEETIIAIKLKMRKMNISYGKWIVRKSLTSRLSNFLLQFNWRKCYQNLIFLGQNYINNLSYVKGF